MGADVEGEAAGRQKRPIEPDKAAVVAGPETIDRKGSHERDVTFHARCMRAPALTIKLN